MKPTDVFKYGTDTSGRPIYMNRLTEAAWNAFKAKVGKKIADKMVIVQGGYMSRVPGGGASDSAGYHDGGGALDTRTWNLTRREQRKVIKAARSTGWAVWKRGPSAKQGNMDEHMHWALLDDPSAASGLKWQMSEYRLGNNGLSNRGKDYHWRPKPIKAFSWARYLASQRPKLDAEWKLKQLRAMRVRADHAGNEHRVELLNQWIRQLNKP